MYKLAMCIYMCVCVHINIYVFLVLKKLSFYWYNTFKLASVLIKIFPFFYFSFNFSVGREYSSERLYHRCKLD